MRLLFNSQGEGGLERKRKRDPRGGYGERESEIEREGGRERPAWNDNSTLHRRLIES